MTFLTALASILLARNGYPLLSFIGRQPGGALAKYGAGLLTGVIVFGLGVISLALAGLLYPGLILLLLAAMALPSRLPIIPRKSGTAIFQRIDIFLLAILACVSAILALTPITEIDAFVYHLASGWQFLQAHRVLIADVPTGFLYPLPVEMAFIPALLAGDDRLTTCLSLACFAAVSLIYADIRRSRSSWLGPLIALSAGPLLTFITGGKNDAIASSLFVGGALLLDSGNPRTGAFLLGSCASAKPVFAPLVALWWIFARPQKERLLGMGSTILLAPSLPWLAKSFLATGNPFYPFGAGLIPTFGWGAENMGRYMDYWSPLWMEGTDRWSTLPAAFLRGLGDSHLLLALAIPGLLAFFPKRRMHLIVLLAAELVTLKMGHTTRYWMPSIWLISLYAAEGLSYASPRIKRFLVPAVGVWTICALILRPAIRNFPAAAEISAGTGENNGSYGEAGALVSRAGARHVLLVGELRTYLLPARAIYDGMLGETPVTWKIARESRGAEDAARKLRQYGIGFILYNFISPSYGVVSVGRWFPWNERMGRLWESFCRARLETLSATGSCDYSWGGYYLYRIRRTPLRIPEPRIFYLPGADALSAKAGVSRANGDHAGAANEFQRLTAEYPGVLSFRCEQAGEYARMFRWRETVALLRPALVSRMMHPSIPMFGMALFGLKDFSGARTALRESLPRYHADDTMIRLGLAGSCIELARKMTAHGRYTDAEDSLHEAEITLSFHPVVKRQDAEKTVLENRAWITAVRAGIQAAQGKCAAAAILYRTAADLVPGFSEAETWRDRADQPCGGE